MSCRRFGRVVIAPLLAACVATGDGAPPAVASPRPDIAASAHLPEPLRADAAQRGQVRPAEVQLIAEERVTWRDGALGCPQPERMYTQGVVPGFRFQVEAGQQVLVYHADRRGRWVWCPPERRQEPLSPAR